MNPTLWNRMDRYPPILVRLCAREANKYHSRALSDATISQRSGLAVYQVSIISQQLGWDHIDIPTARKFLTACNCDFFSFRDMNRLTVYLSRIPTWQHLKVSDEWEALYEPMMLRYQQHVKGKLK